MNQLFLVAADYLKGKPVYEPVRRALNFIFTASISSYIFQKFYGQYEWYDISNYKAILNFFIKGDFFIPLSIYLIVFGTLTTVSASIFALLVHESSIRQKRSVISYEIKKEHIDERIASLNDSNLFPVQITPALIQGLASELKTHLTQEALIEFQDSMKKPKEDTEAFFHLLFRAAFAITLYFVSLPQFGWLLYSAALTILVIAMYLAVWGYRLAEMIPSLISKFKMETEKYILSYYDLAENELK